MRAVFTLGGLLIVVAIIAVLFSKYSIPVAHEGKKAQDEARQMSGHGDDGIPADRTIKLDDDSAGIRAGRSTPSRRESARRGIAVSPDPELPTGARRRH